MVTLTCSRSMKHSNIHFKFISTKFTLPSQALKNSTFTRLRHVLVRPFRRAPSRGLEGLCRSRVLPQRAAHPAAVTLAPRSTQPLVPAVTRGRGTRGAMSRQQVRKCHS